MDQQLLSTFADARLIEIALCLVVIGVVHWIGSLK